MALAFLRRHKWYFNWFLVAIIVSFIYLYIPAFRDSGAAGSGAIVAKVADREITADEFRRTWLRQQDRFKRMYQGMDPSMLRRLGLDQQALDALVTDRVVALEAARLGITVDDDAVAHRVATDPQFQVGGQFMGGAELKRLLEAQGMSEDEFVQLLRSDMLRDRLQALVTDGVTVTPAEAEQEYRRRNEKVKAEYALVDAARFRDQIQVTDAEVRSRFDAKKDAYRLPERRVVSYVLVQPQALAGRVPVTPGDLASYYAAHQDEFKEEPQVCASHILIKVKAGDAPAGHPDAEAKAMAQALLDKAKAGADFAALATASSEDEGSAKSGGDLGCFGHGRMVPEFEAAAFKLQPGQTSDLVKTTYGYHVIRVTSVKPETNPSLEQVKDRVRAMLVEERTHTMADEQAAGMRAALAKGESLDQAARERGLTIVKSPPMSHGQPVPPLTSPTLVARAFELKPGETAREPFVVGSDTAFIALAEVQPARPPDFKEVQDQVKADLVTERAFERARAEAAQLKARAEQDGLDKAAAAAGFARKETAQPVSREEPFGELGTSGSLEGAFTLPEKTLSDPLRVATGYAVVRVLERTPVDPAGFAKEQATLMTSLRDERKSQLFQSYLAQARQRFTVERYPDAIQRVVG